jgi:hypothetical protein
MSYFYAIFKVFYRFQLNAGQQHSPRQSLVPQESELKPSNLEVLSLPSASTLLFSEMMLSIGISFLISTSSVNLSHAAFKIPFTVSQFSYNTHLIVFGFRHLLVQPLIHNFSLNI